MKRTLANKPLLTSSASIPAAAFRISAAVPVLTLQWSIPPCGRCTVTAGVKREGECRSYRYTLIDTTAVTESDPSVQYRQRPRRRKPNDQSFLTSAPAGVRK